MCARDVLIFKWIWVMNLVQWCRTFRVVIPVGFLQNPDLTFEKKPDPTFEKIKPGPTFKKITPDLDTTFGKNLIRILTYFFF